MTRLYLHEGIDVGIDFSQCLACFSALFLMIGARVRTIIGSEIIHEIVLEIHIAKEQTVLATSVDGLEVVALLHLRAGVASPIARDETEAVVGVDFDLEVMHAFVDAMIAADIGEREGSLLVESKERIVFVR